MIKFAPSARSRVSARSRALLFEIISEIGKTAVIRPTPSRPSSFVYFAFACRRARCHWPAREGRGSQRGSYRMDWVA
jgi:hypothetical protein